MQLDKFISLSQPTACTDLTDGEIRSSATLHFDKILKEALVGKDGKKNAKWEGCFITPREKALDRRKRRREHKRKILELKDRHQARNDVSEKLSSMVHDTEETISKTFSSKTFPDDDAGTAEVLPAKGLLIHEKDPLETIVKRDIRYKVLNDKYRCIFQYEKSEVKDAVKFIGALLNKLSVLKIDLNCNSMSQPMFIKFYVRSKVKFGTPVTEGANLLKGDDVMARQFERAAPSKKQLGQHKQKRSIPFSPGTIVKVHTDGTYDIAFHPSYLNNGMKLKRGYPVRMGEGLDKNDNVYFKNKDDPPNVYSAPGKVMEIHDSLEDEDTEKKRTYTIVPTDTSTSKSDGAPLTEVSPCSIDPRSYKYFRYGVITKIYRSGNFCDVHFSACEIPEAEDAENGKESKTDDEEKEPEELEAVDIKKVPTNCLLGTEDIILENIPRTRIRTTIVGEAVLALRDESKNRDDPDSWEEAHIYDIRHQNGIMKSFDVQFDKDMKVIRDVDVSNIQSDPHYEVCEVALLCTESIRIMQDNGFHNMYKVLRLSDIPEHSQRAQQLVKLFTKGRKLGDKLVKYSLDR